MATTSELESPVSSSIESLKRESNEGQNMRNGTGVGSHRMVTTCHSQVLTACLQVSKVDAAAVVSHAGDKHSSERRSRMPRFLLLLQVPLQQAPREQKVADVVRLRPIRRESESDSYGCIGIAYEVTFPADIHPYVVLRRV